jgi:hypothetical protein
MLIPPLLPLCCRLDNYAQMSTNIKQLKTVVYRLTATLGITSIASLLRLGMCILQIYSLKGSQPIWNVCVFFFSSAHLPQEEFPQYGLLWFLFAEFIPRGISAVALMHLMRNTNDAKKREKLTTGRYALSSSLTSAKKGDFSFHQVSSSLFHLSIHFFNRSRVPPPPPMTTTATPWVTV